MTIEDFNEEEFQIIASSDQLFEDLPLKRVIINDLDFGFECNECNRFSTRTASERERVESIEHQPWCKTAFLPALLGLLGIGSGAAAAGTGAAAAGTAAASSAGAAAAGTVAAEGAAAAGAGVAAGAAEGALAGSAGTLAAGELAASTAPALAEGAGAASLSGAGAAASPGLAAKVLDFAKQPMVQQGLMQFNNNQAQKQQEREQQEQINELARQSSAKWGRIIIADRDSEMANIPIEGPLSEEELGGLLSKRFSSEPLEGAHKTTTEDDDGGHESITCQEPDCPVPTNGIHDDHQKSEGSLYRKFHHLGPDAYRQVIDKSRRMMWQKINRQRVNQGKEPFGS